MQFIFLNDIIIKKKKPKHLCTILLLPEKMTQGVII